jgi:hypothetical protein
MHPKPIAAAPLAGKRPVRGFCPKRAGDPSTNFRSPSRSTSLAFPQTKEGINKLAFAESLLPADTSWSHLTIVLDQSAYCVADPRAYLALQGRILRAVQRWLTAKGLPAFCIWIREIGPRYGQAHTHVLLPVPPHLRSDLAELIRHTGRLEDTSNNRAVVITPEKDRWTGEPDTKGMHTRAMRAGVMRDMLQTLSPRAYLDGVSVLLALGIRHRSPCVIYGKRSGGSENLGRKARAAAGWQELVTLPELRAALPTGDEARKARQKQRRHRARKATSAAPMPPPARPKPADPFDVSDLAADFLEV